MIDSEVSEDLAVDLDTLSVESTHQARVRETLETSSSVDTLDPQSTEVTLLVLTIVGRRRSDPFPKCSWLRSRRSCEHHSTHA